MRVAAVTRAVTTVAARRRGGRPVRHGQPGRAADGHPDAAPQRHRGDPADFSAKEGPGPLPDLSPREREILDRIAAGQTNPVIAHQLGVSEKTVRNNVSAIFLKLQVADRPSAIVRAREAGLGRAP